MPICYFKGGVRREKLLLSVFETISHSQERNNLKHLLLHLFLVCAMAARLGCILENIYE